MAGKSVFKITHDLGSNLYSYSKVLQYGKDNKNGEYPEFFMYRGGIDATYDTAGTEGAEFNSYTLGSRQPEDLYYRVYEKDDQDNYYAVDYLFDDHMNMYHVARWCVSTRAEITNEDGSISYEFQDSGSWSNYCVYDRDETQITQTETITINNNEDITAEEMAEERFEASTGYQVSVEDLLTFSTTWQHETDGSEFFNAKPILGIFGIPYQFMPHVDPRINYSKAGSGSYLTLYESPGREYSHHIIGDMPIFFISPGYPNFLRGVSGEDKQSVIDYFADALTGSATTDSLLETTGRYYTFEYAVDDYYNYVNPACRIAAIYMGVNDRSINGSRLDNMNWMTYTTNTLSSLFANLKDVATYMSIPFYIESETQISESFSNDVTDSTLASTVDSVSDLGREIMFVLGYGNSALGANLTALNNMADVEQVRSSIRDIFGTYAEGNGFIANVINHLTSVATGGRLIFPKIWSDSSFSRSYDVTIKLRSPDMDPLSIYCNIIAPYLHLLCLVLPRQINENPNGFYSPFIVRALYKGFFNIDMGIISSMSVTRGDTGMWTPDGIPCSIDVNLTIADLYENISMTPTGWNEDNSLVQSLKYDTLDNTCFMDYIANLCGINMYVPELKRTLNMWVVNNFTNRITDTINIGLWGNIQNSIANAITNVWRRS